MDKNSRHDVPSQTGQSAIPDRDDDTPSADTKHDRPGMKVTHVTDPTPGASKHKDRPTGIVSEDLETGAVDPLGKG